MFFATARKSLVLSYTPKASRHYEEDSFKPPLRGLIEPVIDAIANVGDMLRKALFLFLIKI